MAKMLPQFIAESTVSPAERRLFRLIRDETSDDWTAIHSLGMTTHGRKPWAEIDFVLIGPPGVYCLEVKGGVIGRKSGVWTTTNRHGKTSELKESPFAQVGSASAALFKFLSDRVPAIVNSIAAYAVATPDCIFNIAGPDTIPEIVYDGSDADTPFAAYIDRLTKYWTGKNVDRWSRKPIPLSPVLRESVCKALFKDFDLRPSFRSELAAVRKDLIRYTRDQADVIRALNGNPQMLILGGAGTGKTVLAVDEANRLAAEGYSVLFTCFNRRLAGYLSTLGMDESKIRVTHIHQLMDQLIRDANLRDQLPDAEESDLFRIFYPEFALKALIDHEVPCSFDALVIDEGQDLLNSDYLGVLDVILKGGFKEGDWRVFMDPNQNLFGGIEPAGIRKLKKLKPTEYKLTTNCRNAKPIAVMSCLLSGLPLTEVLKIEGGMADKFIVGNSIDERRKVTETVRMLIHRGVHPSDITILSSRSLKNSCLKDGLIGNVANLADPETPSNESSESIGFTTVQSFKGLEADAILLTDLHDLNSEQFAMASYIGTTRAHGYLAVFIPEIETDNFNRLAKRFGQATVEQQ